jgi:hypothetical protein
MVHITFWYHRWSIIFLVCIQHVSGRFWRWKVRLTGFKSRKMQSITHYWLIPLPFCRTFKPIRFHVVTITATIIFSMPIVGKSLELHLVAIVDTFWRRDRNIEGKTHHLLWVHQDHMLITLMAIVTSLLILRDEQLVQWTQKMSQLVWRKRHHASLRLANVLNHCDSREEMMFVKDHFSRRYFCKRLLGVSGTLYIISLYHNHRIQ